MIEVSVYSVSSILESRPSPFTKKKKIRLQIIHAYKKYFIDFRLIDVELIWKKRNMLMISTSIPPFIYESKCYSSRWNFEEREIRTTDLSSQDINLLKNHKLFVFDFSTHEFRAMKEQIYDIQTSYFSYDSELWSLTANVRFTNNGSSFLRSVYTFIREKYRNLDIGYLIHCCLSERCLNPFHLPISFLEELMKDEEESIQFLTYLYYNGSDVESFDETMQFVNLPFRYFERWRLKGRRRRRKRKKELGQKFEEIVKRIPSNVVRIKRILITPLSIYFIPEEVDVGNSVLRKYPQYISNFVRVSFVDEMQREMKMRHTEPISHRILHYLLKGIHVGGYHFKFLAFSNSQLRGGSLWMFHEPYEAAYNPKEEVVTCQSIRKWMGDFSSIKNLAKYCARLGQCLSTTRSTLDLKPQDFDVREDITSWDEKYIFTDGCGMISETLTRKVVKKLNLREFRYQTDYLPGAFQIRFNGAKGVLAVYPDRYLRPFKIVLRKSQMKFRCVTQYNLGVIRYSNFRPCYLNRQIIALLSTRGIKDSVFLRHQQNMINMLEEMFENEEVALMVLSKFSTNNDLSAILIRCISSGAFPLSHPFIRSCLRSISRYKRIDLQQKSKIFVEKGSLMIGVCDESRTLRYGEVFIRTQQFVSAGNSETGRNVYKSYIHKGPVVVSKNPAFHPGDIRVLKAVDVPALRHLSNVIVFPVSGKRDHPNEISGSDLDGDIYLVCWAYIPSGIF